MNKINVFVYGTLMFERTFRSVTGMTDEDYTSVPATLKDFERRSVVGAGYPAIFHNEGKEVHGRLIKDLSEEVLARLDRYEGEGRLYLRKHVRAFEEGSQEPTDCFVYVWGNGTRSLANGDWEFDSSRVK